MKVVTLLLLLLFLVLFCYGCESSSSAKPEILDNISKNNWSICSNVDSIPEPLRNHFTFDLANPDAPYQSTDIIEESLPSRQLRLLAHADDIWVMIYKHGGRRTY